MGVIGKDSFDMEKRIAALKEKKATFDDPEVQSLVDDFRKFYPPVIPIVSFKKGDVIGPITAASPLHIRYIVEFFSQSFRQEASVIYGHNVPLQFSAFKRKIEFEAWFAYLDSIRSDFTPEETKEIAERENIDSIKAVVGCLLFYKDPKLTEEQKKTSEWVGAFAWIHPFYRKTGALQAIIGAGKRYGDYWLEGPLSPAMEAICKKWGIAPERVLSAGRNREAKSDNSQA